MVLIWISATLCICARAVSTTCSGQPKALAAEAIFSTISAPFFSLACAVSLRQANMASRAAFTASRALFDNPGIGIGLKLRGVISRNLLCMTVPPAGASQGPAAAILAAQDGCVAYLLV